MQRGVEEIIIQSRYGVTIDEGKGGLYVITQKDTHVRLVEHSLMIRDPPSKLGEPNEPNMDVTLFIACTHDHIKKVNYEGSSTLLFLIPLDASHCSISLAGECDARLIAQQAFGVLNVTMVGCASLKLYNSTVQILTSMMTGRNKLKKVKILRSASFTVMGSGIIVCHAHKSARIGQLVVGSAKIDVCKEGEKL